MASGGTLRRNVDDARVELAGGGEFGGEGGQLGRVGQLAEPEQIGGLFEGGLAGELVDVDATIGKDAGLSVDEANG